MTSWKSNVNSISSFFEHNISFHFPSAHSNLDEIFVTAYLGLLNNFVNPDAHISVNCCVRLVILIRK